MHMKYETKGLMSSALWPIVLLIWAMLALLNEGGAWHDSRQNIEILDRDGFQKPDSYSLDEYLKEVNTDKNTPSKTTTEQTGEQPASTEHK